MSIENLLNYSVDNTIINHYLKLLAERDIAAARRNTALVELLRLSQKALTETREELRLAEEAKARLVLINTLTKLESTQVKPANINEQVPIPIPMPMLMPIPVSISSTSIEETQPQKTTVTKANEIGISIGQFVAYSDGTLLDTYTDLMWCRYTIGQQWINDLVIGDEKKMDWEKAKKAAALFNKTDACGGFSDWRLPTIDDFPTIKDKSNPIYRDDNIFPVNGEQFWSCSEYDNNFAKISEFLRGSDSYQTRHKHSACYVRLVRG